MKILVTGGAGFIGSNFIDYWLREHESDEIINFDIMNYAASPDTVKRHAKKWGNKYLFVRGDICNQIEVENQVKNVELVVNFAAQSHVDRSIKDPNSFAQVNILGTMTLMNACRKFGNIRFHQISTDEVFGTLELGSSERFNAESPLQPRSPYAASKASAEHFVNAYFETFELPVTMTNCSNNYGPYQFPEKVIPLYITRAMQNKSIPIYGTGQAIRDYLYVEDHCRGIENVIIHGVLGQKYAIGGGEALNTLQVAEIILKKLGKSKDLIRHTPDRAGHDMMYLVDPKKIQEKLGWRAKESFATGIDKTIKWYIENESWWKPLLLESEKVANDYLSK